MLRRWTKQATIAACLCMRLSAQQERATVIDTGSTNRPGIQVTVTAQGEATMQERDGSTTQIQIGRDLSERFIRDIKASLPLSSLEVRHCAKSVSFGSSLFVEMNGDRSRDLSCPAQTDERCATLQKDAHDILSAVQKH